MIVVGWVAWASLLFLIQRRMLFPGRGVVRAAPAPLERISGLERLQLQIPGGVSEVWLIPARGKSPLRL